MQHLRKHEARHAPRPSLSGAARGGGQAGALRTGTPVRRRRRPAPFRRWLGVELDADGDHALYIPRGCAHGFLTLADDTAVYYHMGTEYAPDLARDVRWNDPAFAISWPFDPLHISPRDAAYPDFAP